MNYYTIEHARIDADDEKIAPVDNGPNRGTCPDCYGLGEHYDNDEGFAQDCPTCHGDGDAPTN